MKILINEKYIQDLLEEKSKEIIYNALSDIWQCIESGQFNLNSIGTISTDHLKDSDEARRIKPLLNILCFLSRSHISRYGKSSIEKMAEKHLKDKIKDYEAYIGKEDYIDKIVDRINRKQLAPK